MLTTRLSPSTQLGENRPGQREQASTYSQHVCLLFTAQTHHTWLVGAGLNTKVPAHVLTTVFPSHPRETTRPERANLNTKVPADILLNCPLFRAQTDHTWLVVAGLNTKVPPHIIQNSPLLTAQTHQTWPVGADLITHPAGQSTCYIPERPNLGRGSSPKHADPSMHPT